MKFATPPAGLHRRFGNLYFIACLLVLFSTTAIADNISDGNQPTSDDKHNTPYGNVWINNTGTLLYGDTDRDSFFSGLSLTIDADTDYRSTRVYVAIDLTDSLQQTERLHTTSDFYVYGTSLSDEYRVDIDLIRNYDTARYSVTLTLIDASTDRVLDRVGEDEFSNLRRLPLESEDLDHDAAPANDIETAPNIQPNDDVRVVEFGGGTGIVIGSMLIGTLLFRRTLSPTQLT